MSEDEKARSFVSSLKPSMAKGKDKEGRGKSGQRVKAGTKPGDDQFKREKE